MDIRMIKPISYIKAHAAEVLDKLGRDGQPVGITQHGEIKAVLVAANEYQRTQETLAFLKLIALGDDDVKAGRTRGASDFLKEMQSKVTAHAQK